MIVTFLIDHCIFPLFQKPDLSRNLGNHDVMITRSAKQSLAGSSARVISLGRSGDIGGMLTPSKTWCGSIEAYWDPQFALSEPFSFNPLNEFEDPAKETAATASTMTNVMKYFINYLLES
jgi:hypothetical protein